MANASAEGKSSFPRQPAASKGDNTSVIEKEPDFEWHCDRFCSFPVVLKIFQIATGLAVPVLGSFSECVGYKMLNDSLTFFTLAAVAASVFFLALHVTNLAEKMQLPFSVSHVEYVACVCTSLVGFFLVQAYLVYTAYVECFKKKRDSWNLLTGGTALFTEAMYISDACIMQAEREERQVLREQAAIQQIKTLRASAPRIVRP